MKLNEWEQSNIGVLTSREMGEWLCRRENRLLEQIRKEMNDLEKKTIEDVCLDECRPCVYTTFEYVRQIIDKYKYR